MSDQPNNMIDVPRETPPGTIEQPAPVDAATANAAPAAAAPVEPTASPEPTAQAAEAAPAAAEAAKPPAEEAKTETPKVETAKVETPRAENMDWYILKVQSNREESIREGLMRRVAIAGLDRFFGDVIVPTEKVTEFKGGKKRVI